MNILITGTGSGIGYDAAIELAENNHTVFAVVKSKSDVSKFKNFKNIKAIKCDITQQSDRDKLEKLSIDVLINNAGVGESGPVTRVPLKKIRNNYEVNVMGTLALIQQFAAKMIEKKSGRIINVTSVAGKISMPYLGIYSSTKFALEAISDSLRLELAEFGIFVSIIEPGPIATGFNEKMIASKKEWMPKSEITQKEKQHMEKFHDSLVSKQYSTKTVVNAIVEAVESSSPKARYVAPPFYGFLVWLATLVPDSVRDFILKKI